MEEELQGIVDFMLPEIESKLNYAPSTFKLWFGDFKLIFLDDEKAVFTTPTNLRKNILSTKYLSYIKDALKNVVGFDVKVEIISNEKRETFVEDTVEEKVLTEEEKRENLEREVKIKTILNGGGEEERKSLLDEYTFDNFIEGASNKFAKAACYAVANTLATDFNPLFIHGNSGLGKTHLLCAVINHMKVKYPKLKIVYKKCEDFMNELIEAITNFTTSSFKEKYRGADVLLIDDIQFIAGKVSTQEEFFHTFSYLYESNRHIILTSDRPPHEIKPLEERIRTRFEGGLIADIQPPSIELRTAIIRKKSEAMGLSISPALVDYIAERLHENIRQIEGVVKKLSAFRVMYGEEEVTKESIDRAISFVDPENIPVDILIERIIKKVSSHYGVSVEDLKSKKKTSAISNARHVACYIIRKLTDKSFKEIGIIFSRDHTSIMHSCDTVKINIKTIKNTDAEIKKLIKEIKEM